MKINIPRLILGAVLLSSIFLPGCKNREAGNGQIALNERRARQHIIPIAQARRLQENFIQGREELQRLLVKDSPFVKTFRIPNAESFNRDAIALLLNQKGCDGIRIYYGKDAGGEFRLVLLPVDSTGADIHTSFLSSKPNAINIPGISGAKAAPYADGNAIETGQICPPCTIVQ